MKWKNEAMEKLRRYDAMRQALRNIPEEIARLKADAYALRSAVMDTTPVKGGGSRREEALINNLVERQELEQNLKQVRRWLAVTDRGLLALSQDERLVLQRLYLYPEQGAMERLCCELGVEQSTIYRKRDEALRRFTLAMYGFAET
ncbi:MAG: DUF1492 domain-containing protein [Ruminococcaceae bacterium]|nr:DUF1492 domain-containing protein [Oscillospiraceae bacterium]